MAYQVLARKWRPPDFSSVIGQEPIVTALRNALTEERIAQAYLFSGIRGVGKTTAARVLAKALNCERGPAADPCNECTSCREIATNSDLDVIEVDAATYSKVEQVRELTESLRYGPARDRYKVVVIDEIHRLSRQAFDALLKIIEEPPPHLVFIFATTEIDAVPATVLSRCQEFHFRRVPSETVAGLLREIAGREGIEASDPALRLIARAGEGSVRDSIALLDQLATFGSGAIEDDDAVRLLGGMDTALFEEVLTGILAGDRAAVARAVRRIESEGWDPRGVYAQFLAYCRDALHLALATPGAGRGRGGPAAEESAVESVDLPAEEAERLAERARAAGFESLLRLLRQLLESEETVRRSDSATLALEIAWLRAAELPRLTRIEDLLAGRAALPEALPESEPGAESGSGGDGRPAAGRASGASAPSEGSGTESAPATSRGPVDPPSADQVPEKPRAAGGPASVETFLERLSDRKASLAAALREAQERTFGDDTLTIVVAPGQEMVQRRLERESNRRLLDEVVQEIFGDGARWESRRGTAPPPSGKPAPEASSPAGDDAEETHENPTVQTVLEIFDGTVEDVEETEET